MLSAFRDDIFSPKKPRDGSLFIKVRNIENSRQRDTLSGSVFKLENEKKKNTSDAKKFPSILFIFTF